MIWQELIVLVTACKKDNNHNIDEGNTGAKKYGHSTKKSSEERSVRWPALIIVIFCFRLKTLSLSNDTVMQSKAVYVYIYIFFDSTTITIICFSLFWSFETRNYKYYLISKLGLYDKIHIGS